MSQALPPAEAPPVCELDRRVLDSVQRLRRQGEAVSALIAGHGAEAQGVRMALAGATVCIARGSEALPEACSTLPGVEYAALLGDAALPGEPFDLILCQRTLSRLRYTEARHAVRTLLRRLRIGGHLYLSLYGIHSELGDHYPDSGKFVEERYALLPADLAERYGLRGPVCLYSERNLFSLLFEAGAGIVHTSTSPAGNVRGIATRI